MDSTDPTTATTKDRTDESGSQDLTSLVRVCDQQVFHALACGAVRLALEAPKQSWLVCADAHTIHHVGALSRLLSDSGRLFILGGTPEPPSAFKDAEHRPADASGAWGARLFVLQSETVQFCIHGNTLDGDDFGAPNFDGGWTSDPEYVSACLAGVLGEDAAGSAAESSPQHSVTLGLAALHANALAADTRHMARDKADLSSVLDILKSISTKRRAHDVLYVFVEHIAQVIKDMRRCSVVRVWADQKHGHVLASHEDQNLREYTIDLEKYPELSEALRVGETINVPCVAEHPLTAPFAGVLSKAKISSLLVIPIVLFDEEIGSLFLRAARSEGVFQRREISFLEIAAEAASSALERAQLFDNIQRANERLVFLAKTDGLTGLYNYRHFRDRLEEEFSRATRYGLPLSCIIFDVDNFKVINDTHGHLAGDSVLRAIAKRTLKSVRTLDIVARYGGEEFAILMPQTEIAGARIEAERIRQAISAEAFDISASISVKATVSIGIAEINPERMESTDALIHAADEALYQAKHAGKNRVAVRDTD